MDGEGNGERKQWRMLVIGLFVSIFVISLLFLNELTFDIFLAHVLTYRYTMLFVLIFFASLILPLPINATLSAVGAYSLFGYFDLLNVFLISVLANMFGHSAAYFFFYYYGHSILRDKYVAKYKFFLRLEEFFKKYEGLSIFVSRIIGLFGPPVNFLAGYVKMSFLKFSVFNLLGSAAFTIIFLALGYVLGANWEIIYEYIGYVMGVITITVLAIIIKNVFIKNN